MKPLPLTLVVLCLFAVAGVTSAYLMIGKSEPVQVSDSRAADGRGKRSDANLRTEPLSDATSGVHDAGGTPSSWPCDLANELRDVKAELSAVRRALDQSGVRTGSGSEAAPKDASAGERWRELLHDAETRLFVERIVRQRARARVMLSQEQASVGDAEASSEVRRMATTAVDNLQRALDALDAVRSADQLSKWCEEYSIEPVE